MGQGITPIAFRTGFSRIWESLYTETLYFRNYNYFMKSQLLCAYIQGFFNKWMWNRRRSYFLNFVFSHVELNWSYNFLNLYVYVYNTSLEYLKYNLARNIFLNKKYLSFNYNRNITIFDIKKKYDLQMKFVNFYFAKYNFTQLYKSINTSYYLKKNFKKKQEFLRILNIYIKKKKKHYSHFKFFIRKLSVFKQFFFGKRGLIHNYGLNFKKYKKNKYSKNVFSIYLFLLFVLKSKLYNSFLIFFNYFIVMKPLENLLKRFIYKDFYYLFNFYKFKNLNDKFNLSLVRLNTYSVTSSVYVRHMWLKLYKKYNFTKIIYGLLRSVTLLQNFKGLLIRCNGRFTKKQRAWHSVYRYGNMPLSKQDALIDDAVIHVKLKYGISTVRVNFNCN